MDDITAAILDAWETIGPKIVNNPLELAKRLARRRMKTLRRPMRPWCVAVRAADARINPATAAIVPEDAAYPRECIAPGLEGYYPFAEHEVTLTAKLLRTICRPITILPGGDDWKQVAKRLGRTKNALRTAIDKRKFEVRHCAGYAGQFGKPIPMIWSDYALDPNAGRLAERPEPACGSAWQTLAEQLPDDFEQTLTRAPTMRSMRGRLVWRGWSWICPGCRRAVRIVYYPQPPMNLPTFFGIDPANPAHEWDQIEPPVPTFACVRCHGVRHFSRMDKNSWNELIHHLSGGLLYGYEVPRPTWLTRDRKRRFVSPARRPPSKRREEVLQRLVLGWTDKQIARDLGISYHRARNLAAAVFKRRRVKGRKDLMRQFQPESFAQMPPNAVPRIVATAEEEKSESREPSRVLAH